MLDAAARTQYGPLILREIEAHFPELLIDIPRGWLIIHAQVWQESRWQPTAKSPVGAAGLLQLMPATDFEIDGDYDGFNPEGNLDNGIRYLAHQYRRLNEIPDPDERIRFALASYNCGRGYVNKALMLARMACNQPASYSRWNRAGRHAGRWQTWSFTAPRLADQMCEIRGRRPDYKQATDYVSKIMNRYEEYRVEATA
ncbi:MAG: hypothetical protein C0622_02280 [Desulfuromonas sp.]|nr:MAG: hypothetical protein C0622_02280 [Desulfuromonas sp.]